MTITPDSTDGDDPTGVGDAFEDDTATEPIDLTRPPPARRGGLGARRRIALIVVLACVLVSGGGLAAASLVKSPAEVAAETEPPDVGPLTATVEKRVLASTLVVRGTVAAARQTAVTPLDSAQGATTAVVTRVRAIAGATVRAGDVLLEVSGRPLVVLGGALPAYRDLKPGDEGDDVAQLQRSLRSIGRYHGGDRSGYFGASTKNAVSRFYESIGYDAPQTGGPGGAADEEARTAARTAVETAQRAVDDMRRRIAAQPSPAPSTPPGEEPLRLQLSYLNRDLTRAEQAEEKVIARTGPMVPVAELVFLPAFPARVAQSTAKVGEPVQAPLITLSTGALQVTAKLRPDQGKLLKRGMKVRLTAEVIGATANGTVAGVGEPRTDDQSSTSGPAAQTGQAQPQQQQAGPAYTPLTVTPAKPLAAAWNGQDVRLTITAAQTSAAVLVVPLSAVSSGADGRTTVSRVGAGGEITRVEVTAGISGDGFVEVAPAAAGLSAGDQVVIGQ